MSENAPVIIRKKKVQGGHAHHGGSWKVAYADFVTAMMAFFMVMWIMGLSDQTRAQIQGYFNDPIGFAKNMPRSNNIVDVMKMKYDHHKSNLQNGGVSSGAKDDHSELMRVKKNLEKALDQEKNTGVGDLKNLLEHVEIAMTDEGLRIEFHESAGSVFFESGSASIRPQAMKLIEKVVPVLMKSGRLMRIEGHTDAKPFAGKNYTNWDLSTDRARSLCHALTEFGLPEKQFQGVMGYADTKLKMVDQPYHFSNRRVTLLLPYGARMGGQIDLPREAFKNEVQGVFRAPESIDLPKTDITSGKNLIKG